ncbi:carbohydrate ABC transporter permease [Treponema sp. OMZ 857]|uniref:carbohydrate ABC transporter permease n=1 Tax=Treponema sp. OMZ 857 TaxID=1643513 RepID=UPI0020A3ED64|nr:sugar ABC transporter permease [Treponema sp. OMZ 857]UTC43155.1 sugar ABC transporter permease [Treponema sp. OMZ 857]
MTKKNIITKHNVPYILLAPTIIIFAVFMVYPVFRSLYLSFYEYRGGTYEFIHWENYIKLFQDGIFFKSLFNTFVYLLIQVPVMVVGALLIAVLIEQKFIRAKAFFRAAIFLPSVTALVAYALVFKVLMNSDYGLINYVLKAIGLPPVNWFYGEWSARFAIIIAITWRWLGYNMIILLAGIQAIPEELTEAAQMSGASLFQILFYITIPIIKPVILFCTITSTIGTLQLFDEPFILTEGGPNNATLTAGQYLFNNGFTYLKFGYASAVGYILVLLIAALSILQFKITNRSEI